MITVEQALEAIDNLDDYARMNVGVDAVGPRGVLVSFCSQSAQLRAENERLKAALHEVVFACRTKISMKQKAREALFNEQTAHIPD